MSDWTVDAACSGLDAGPWYPTRGESGAAAKAVCAGCPVIRACAVESVTTTKIHYSSAEGIRAGMGGAIRRLMIRAVADCDHNPEMECSDPECAWCRTFDLHVTALREGARIRVNVNGSGAVHGRKSTGARGCACAMCRWARSTIGQRLAEHVDAVAWLEWLFAPIPENEGSAPAATGDWVDLDDDHAAALLGIAKIAASRTLEAAA